MISSGQWAELWSIVTSPWFLGPMGVAIAGSAVNLATGMVGATPQLPDMPPDIQRFIVQDRAEVKKRTLKRQRKAWACVVAATVFAAAIGVAASSPDRPVPTGHFLKPVSTTDRNGKTSREVLRWAHVTARLDGSLPPDMHVLVMNHGAGEPENRWHPDIHECIRDGLDQDCQWQWIGVNCNRQQVFQLRLIAVDDTAYGALVAAAIHFKEGVDMSTVKGWETVDAITVVRQSNLTLKRCRDLKQANAESWEVPERLLTKG